MVFSITLNFFKKNNFFKKYFPLSLIYIYIYIYIYVTVRSQIVAQTQIEKGDGPNKPGTINL